MKQILIIEDDPAILKGLEASLEEENYQLLTASDGHTGCEMAKDKNVDLILLDIMLPLKDGMEICRELRSNNVSTPILILTSKKEETDKILGLEFGADDYVTKPFSIRELNARIKALLRRAELSSPKIDNYVFGDVTINFQKLEASKGQESLKLSAKEFEIMKFFIEHESEVVSRDMFLDEVWGYDVFPTTRTVDTFILNLRKKIEHNPSEPKHLITIYKSGYKFIP